MFQSKYFGNNIIFQNLIEELSELEKNGINININGEEKKVYVVLIAVIGDNLGLNQILGFNTSFNSTYCCRVCKVDKDLRMKQLVEDINLIRTKNEYMCDVENLSNGILEECVFHKLKYFHVSENFTLDVMHDIYEGICRYEMGQILYELIVIEKLFSLEVLNNRIKFFDFGNKFNLNKPLCISETSLKKRHLIVSASEMASFVTFFGLIIGELVPPDNIVWKLWILLREIVCTIMSPSFNNETLHFLKNIISEHHELYLKLFSDSTLKPKHHFLLHYPLIIKKYGPIKYLSSIRFEGKHKQFKNISSAVTSRLHPSHTLALKHQLYLNYRFFVNEGFSDKLHLGPQFKYKSENIKDYHKFKNKIPLNINDYNFANWVNICGTIYKPEMAVTIGTNDILPKFGKIKYVLIHENNEIYFIVLKMLTISFIEHFHAYEVKETKNWDLISQKYLIDYSTYNFHVLSNGITCVSCI